MKSSTNKLLLPLVYKYDSEKKHALAINVHIIRIPEAVYDSSNTIQKAKYTKKHIADLCNSFILIG